MESNINSPQTLDAPDLRGIGILLVDSDPAYLRKLKKNFSSLGADIHMAMDLEDARKVIFEEQIHTVLTEFGLYDGKGTELLSDFEKYQGGGLFYLMSEQTSLDMALEAVKQGADYFLEKPVNYFEIAQKIEKSLSSRSTTIAQVDPLIKKLRPYLLFRSEIMRQGLQILPQVASSNQSVLVTGETGSGKEMVARAIHGLSSFSEGPFVGVNCGAIPESLIEGELFGHEKGAFTGANSQRKGKFEQAQNGTLFLDEIGEMPLSLQVRLLRALEERQIYRIGSEKPLKVNVRVVAATRANLEQSVEEGLFREDLYYRLNILRIKIPSLRERPDDIPLLAWSFLERAFAEMGRDKYPHFSSETIALLKDQVWKGNVRELKNTITRVAILLPDEAQVIGPQHLIPYLSERESFLRDTAKNRAFSYTAPNPAHNPYSKPVKPIDDSIEIEEVNNFRENKPFNNKDSFREIKEINPDWEIKQEINRKPGIFIPVGTTVNEAEDLLIEATLKETNGNKTHAAKILGIGIRTLRRKLAAKRIEGDSPD